MGEDDRVSMRQWLALVWAGMLGVAPELFPGRSAGGAAVIVLLLVWAALVLLGRLYRPLLGEGGLAAGLCGAFGTGAGRMCLLIYIGWGELLLTLHLTACVQRLMDAGERDGGVLFFLTVLGGLSLWMALGQLAALGRAAQLLAGALSWTAGIVLLLSLTRLRMVNLFVPVEDSWRGVLGPVVRMLGFALPALFLLDIQEREKAGWLWRRRSGWWLLALGAAQLVILGVFGPRFSGDMVRPFFQLAKCVGVKGGFQRLESVVTAIWTFGDLALLAGTLWALSRLLHRLWPQMSRRGSAAGLLIPGAVLAGLLLYRGGDGMSFAVGRVLPIGTLILGVGVPVLASSILSYRENHRKER